MWNLRDWVQDRRSWRNWYVYYNQTWYSSEAKDLLLGWTFVPLLLFSLAMMVAGAYQSAVDRFILSFLAGWAGLICIFLFAFQNAAHKHIPKVYYMAWGSEAVYLLWVLYMIIMGETIVHFSDETYFWSIVPCLLLAVVGAAANVLLILHIDLNWFMPSGRTTISHSHTDDRPNFPTT